VLAVRHPGWTLFLAVPEAALRDVFDEPIGLLMIRDLSIQILGFDPAGEVITRWIP
jgi:hypothetical protein